MQKTPRISVGAISDRPFTAAKTCHRTRRGDLRSPDFLVGIGGLAAARSRSRSDNRTGLSFIALAPLRHLDGPFPPRDRFATKKQPETLVFGLL